MTPAEPGQLELCRCGHPFRGHDYGSVNWHCEAGDPGSFCKCDAFNNEAWEYTKPPTEPTTGAILAKIARLKDALAAAEQRALAAEAELQIANSLLVLGKQREQHAEIVRLNQLIVDGDATIMTQGEAIERLKTDVVKKIMDCDRLWSALQAESAAHEDVRGELRTTVSDAHDALDSRHVPRRCPDDGAPLSLGGRIREWRSLQRAALRTQDAEIDRLRAQVATLEAEVAAQTRERRLAEYDRLRQRP